MDISNSLKKYILFSAIGFFVLGLIVILCDALTDTKEEESLEERQNASAYWVGLPYLILGFLMLYLKRTQKTFNVKVCRLFSIVGFILSMLALVFEGPDWSYYQTYNNYICTNGDSATCAKTSNLSALFGSITVSAILAILLCISNIIICNWILFRMSVETPEQDFNRKARKRSIAAQSGRDADDFFKTQGYHACWNDRPTSLPIAPKDLRKQENR